MPEELWTKVHNIVQEPVIKTIPKKKKCKKAKWLSEEALQIAENRREAKGTGEKERYTHLNAEFQRKSRRDKTVFLSDQCKEREVRGAGEAFHSWQRSWGRRLGIRKGGIEPQESPGIFSSIFPQKTRVCLLYCFVLSPLTLLGAVPYHHLALSLSKS